MKKMKTLMLLLSPIALLASPISLHAGQNYASQVKLEMQQPFMCAMKHFHIPGTAKNQSAVSLAHVRIKGEAFDGDNQLLSTAFGKVFSSELKPGEVAAFDVEFLDIVGPQIQKVKDYRVEVVEAVPRP